MKLTSIATVVAALALAAAPSFASEDQTATFKSGHDDYRKTPKLEEFAEKAGKQGSLDAEKTARAFLAEHAASYGIADETQDLKLTSTRQSLVGTHFHFAQMLDGIAVEKGEVIVSVSNKTGAVYSAYNNFYPGQEQLAGKAKRAVVESEVAFDSAWSNLKVHGKLQSAPDAKLVYRVNDKGEFRLVYLTFLDTAAPFGAWQHEIDAYTGKVLSRVETSIERKVSHKKVNPELFTGQVLDRRQAFATFAQKSKNAPSEVTARANGKGLVFDPDPRTTLNASNLQDNSPAADLDAAYFERDLRDLAFDGTTYKLEGPWAKIGDFEGPNTVVSTSTTGRWTAKRGDESFNDAMTYFHLDQSQRYIQSLGFVGAKAIQGAPIEADADGVDGDDNSHYIPTTNKLAYGHGCVDDDEDADVILHEYGHAITFSINANWEGGDTGAMGEGFGDYWGASYSLSTPGGMIYKPFEIYSWDGHGPTDACWPGRVLNATDMIYNPATTYEAHVPIGNHQSDELWSTPLFEALMTLIQQGVPHAEVDQIILEAQFGLGAGIKMRDLAQATILAARRLHPTGPHADVFQQKFAAQHIVEMPQAVLGVDHITYDGLGDDGVADPGEAIDLKVAVGNRGTLPAAAIHATLTSETAGVTVTNAETTFSDTDAGAVVEADEALSLATSGDLACGTAVHLTLTLTFTGGLQPNIVVPIEFNLGKARGMLVSATPNMAIPDDAPAGLTNTIAVASTGNVSANLAVDLNVQHTYIGDLKVSLTSPSGTQVVLHANSDGSADNIVGRYPSTLTPAEALSKFLGEPMAGDWKLQVVDSAAQDTGNLVSWGLYDVAGYECQH